MADRDHKADAGWCNSENDELDRELNAALATYATVEPRAGLEERVLANLRAERTRVPERHWWRWSVAAALAAVAIVAIALAWRLGKPSQFVVKDRPSTTTPVTTKQVPQPSGTQLATNRRGNGVRPQAPRPAQKTAGHHALPVVMAAQPRLDQFPSPRPLSEQEKILASYVAEYPEHAVLIARARTEALRKDQEEEMRAAGEGNDRDSQQPNK